MIKPPARLLAIEPAAGDLLAQAMHATRAAELSDAQLGELQARVLVALDQVAAAPVARAATRPAWKLWLGGCVLLALLGSYVALSTRSAAVGPAPRSNEVLHYTPPALDVAAPPRALKEPARRIAIPIARPVAARTRAASQRVHHHDAEPPIAAETSSELELLRAAESALHVEPAAALAFIERHLRAYPDGLLAQEREVLATQALLALGQRDDAEQRAQRFRVRYPSSPLERRLTRMLAEPGARFGKQPEPTTSTEQEVKP